MTVDCSRAINHFIEDSGVDFSDTGTSTCKGFVIYFS